jgi:hypothetical protein
MNLQDLMQMAADFLSPGATHAPTVRHEGVMSPHMKKMKGRTRPSLGPKRAVKHSFRHGKIHFENVAADASPSDLASHHTWQDPSASDVTIRNWRNKRQTEKTIRRNMDPFDPRARLDAARTVTGPCGCTIALGDRVSVEGIGKGKILSRKDRMLTVALDNGKNRTVDQKFVHLTVS